MLVLSVLVREHMVQTISLQAQRLTQKAHSITIIKMQNDGKLKIPCSLLLSL